MEQGVLRGDTLDIQHNTVPGLFQDLLREHGGHFTHCPAIITQSSTLTYSDVDIISDYWSSHLKKVFRRQQRQSLKKTAEEQHNDEIKENITKKLGQQVIGIFIPPNANRILAMMTIFKAGACYIPLDSTLPDQRIASILEETNCQVNTTYQVMNCQSLKYSQTTARKWGNFSPEFKCNLQESALWRFWPSRLIFFHRHLTTNEVFISF